MSRDIPAAKATKAEAVSRERIYVFGVCDDCVVSDLRLLFYFFFLFLRLRTISRL